MKRTQDEAIAKRDRALQHALLFIHRDYMGRDRWHRERDSWMIGHNALELIGTISRELAEMDKHDK